MVQVVEGRDSMVKHIGGLLVLKHDQAVAALVKRSLNLLVEDHLAELHEDSIDW